MFGPLWLKNILAVGEKTGYAAKLLRLGVLTRAWQVRAFKFENEHPTATIDSKGSYFPKSVILYAVFFYVRYGICYRDLEETTAERGVEIDHATLNRRWLLSDLIICGDQGGKTPTASTWRMDETYIKVRGKWSDLYRAVDRDGQALDFIAMERTKLFWTADRFDLA